MSINITENIKSISDLKNQTQEIFDQIHRTGQPVMVTVNGKPDVVLLDAAVYSITAYNLRCPQEKLNNSNNVLFGCGSSPRWERTIKALNLKTLLAEAETEVKKGNTRPARAFLEELKASAKISG